ncbi:MAG: metallopeptidase family protein [Rubrimonas sp.]|uniref:metallopeptidase family protein n=1 Tax=Rubrimonas sp. TaxID=2036015 RepID=UPI002FDE3C4A
MRDLAAPSAADIDALARMAFADMPEAFRARCPDLVIRVEELADDDTLDELDIDDPFELTGLFDGVALTERSVDDVAPAPNVVTLYRRAILDEWAERGDVALGALVAHVLAHEIGHHFGLSDDDIRAIDDWTA